MPTTQEKLRGKAELPRRLQNPEVHLKCISHDRDVLSLSRQNGRDRDQDSRPRCFCRDRDSVSENNGEKIRRSEQVVTTETISLDRDADTGFEDLKILSFLFY